MQNSPYGEQDQAIEVFQNKFIDLTSNFSFEKRTFINMLAYSLPDWEWFVHELIFRVNQSANDDILINNIRSLDVIATIYLKVNYYFDLDREKKVQVEEHLMAMYDKTSWVNKGFTDTPCYNIDDGDKVFEAIKSIHMNLVEGK